MVAIDIHTTPALKPPYGVESDFDNGYSLKPHLVAASAVCLTMCVFSVVARIFTKVRLLKKVEIEDYALIFSTFGFAAFTGVMIASGVAGQGKHQWDVSVAGLERVALLANVLEIIYPPVMFSAKLAILLQIQRIFTKHERNFNYWAVKVLIASNALTYFALFFAFIFACWPREKIWNPRIEGRCISTNASIIATSAINIVSDITILALPLLSIARLHLPTAKKLGVGAVFATGAFACISSIIRLVYSIRLTETNDITWAIAPVGMWALAEFATVILVGCFPIFPRLWKYLCGKDDIINSKYSHSRERRFIPFKNTDLDTSRDHQEWGDVRSGILPSSYIPLEERSTVVNDVLVARKAMEQLDHASFSPTTQAIVKKSTNIASEYSH